MSSAITPEQSPQPAVAIAHAASPDRSAPAPRVTKPRKRRARATPAPSIATTRSDVELPLTPDEQRWLSLYRKMKDAARVIAMAGVTGIAKKNPRHVAPTLRLLVGGVK